MGHHQLTKIERLGPAEWERGRAIRLRALRDAPNAFWTTLEDVEERPDAWWRARLEDSRSTTFVAATDGGDVGLVVGSPFHAREAAAGLFAMWVASEVRGKGVSGRLVDAVIQWARAAGYQRLVLDVGDDNIAAVRLYERKGFVATGATSCLPPPRNHIREHERELKL